MARILCGADTHQDMCSRRVVEGDPILDVEFEVTGVTDWGWVLRAHGYGGGYGHAAYGRGTVVVEYRGVQMCQAEHAGAMALCEKHWAANAERADYLVAVAKRNRERMLDRARVAVRIARDAVG